ncbi:MAG: bifunctional UDP-N-acetylmuramoyl-tripeptide:D-alanyl-D-alanine ligase/alanine racemase, partial [Bacteroidales bacterium]|nr:bifunctional UDP-N-acetylmuramoyl-tripeptide:D-alanyl-D-alanine ligase/alanine racemase [Bacteroidales bacterium]
IAITGSAGKTVVKEWLADVIAPSMPVMRSPRSYNSQVGVPLSLLRLDNKYKLGIIEAGISTVGEMEKLKRIIDPEIGVLTNIGDAHSEGFVDMRQKAEEKLKLFADCSKIIYCSDQPLVDELLRTNNIYSKKQLVDWSRNNPKASVFVTSSYVGSHTLLQLTYDGKKYSFEIPFDDIASVENAITVAAVCLTMDVDVDIIRNGLASLTSVAMRMEIKNGVNNCQLIEDYYNSDPGSFAIALESLKSHPGNKKKTLILSDFIQSGKNDKELYYEIAQVIERASLDKFIGIGPSLKANANLFEGNSSFFSSTEEFVDQLNKNDFHDEVILLKGARKFEFEKIGSQLEQLVYQTILEVNLNSVANNLNEFRSKLKPETKIMVMVKAFAYGAGALEVAEFLEYNGVSYFGVANVDEGVELRNAGVSLPIIVMNPDASSLDTLIRYNLEPVIYGFESYNTFLNTATKYGLVFYPIHLEVDTGMHRLGFLPNEIDRLAELLSGVEMVKVASMFSHFAASEDPEKDDFTKMQVDRFTKACDTIAKVLDYQFIRHICNSAGIVRFPQYHFNMVRPGIGIYGAGSYEGLSMKTVATFKTKVSQVKRIPANESVGYNCRDVADYDRDIAILPVGYADGLNRLLGNRRGNVFVSGRRVPIIGNICMDACMIDVTDVLVKAGDDVEIFGENIPIDELASICGTIPYEILTSIPHRVKRIFYSE